MLDVGETVSVVEGGKAAHGATDENGILMIMCGDVVTEAIDVTADGHVFEVAWGGGEGEGVELVEGVVIEFLGEELGFGGVGRGGKAVEVDDCLGHE